MTEFDEKFNNIVIELSTLGKVYRNKEVVIKVMRVLPREWDIKTIAMKESKDLNKIELYDLFIDLNVYEFEINSRNEEEESTSITTQALVTAEEPPASTSVKSVEQINDDAMPLFVKKFERINLFYLNNLQKVKWGEVNMIEAERRLLANALLDLSNERFVLLSEACIPLYNFPTVYSYLINTTQNFVESYDLAGAVGRGRYNNRMIPIVTIDKWRKGSQWFQMGRSLALEVVSDCVYFPVFQKHCRGQCYSDEHYLPTFVTTKFAEGNSNRTLTWVDWEKGGPHPTRFVGKDVSVEMLENMRVGSKCEYNGKGTSFCYMFARKFAPDALQSLLRVAPMLMGFVS
ncbi:glycosyltransferase BC10-like [Impatiens glandulifera]|uniref:glycosyltransferase BC10-like n=1 Tax=Impatiens glandulifera TaxID=253017 RepID=UPI001FB1932F|nr:glycosyltransferase BC10-like [Impatiens glandulifera]